MTAAVNTPRASRPAPARPGRRQGLGGRVAALLLGTIWLIIAIAPFDYMIVSSLRTQDGYFTGNPWVPTGELTLANFSDVFGAGLGTYLVNSLVVTVCGIALTLLLSLAFAYHVVKHQTKAAGTLFRMIVIGLAIPVQAIVVPLFVVVTKIKLYDSLTGLVLVLTASALPLSVVVVANFVRDIPNELIQAMRVDGAGDWRILFRLVAPMATGALGIVAVFNGLAMWNNFLVPLLFTQSPSKALLPLGLYTFQSEHGVNVPAVMAAVVLSSLPLILLFVATRKYAMQALGGLATMR